MGPGRAGRGLPGHYTGGVGVITTGPVPRADHVIGPDGYGTRDREIGDQRIKE